MEKIGGIANFCGKSLAFPKDSGIGLVTMEGGEVQMFQFNCPLESLPPRGFATLIEEGTLVLRGGRLMFKEEPVVLGVILQH